MRVHHTKCMITHKHVHARAHTHTHILHVAWRCTYDSCLERIPTLQGQVHPWLQEGYFPNHESPSYKMHDHPQTCACARTHAHTHTYTHTYTHTHTHILHIKGKQKVTDTDPTDRRRSFCIAIATNRRSWCQRSEREGNPDAGAMWSPELEIRNQYMLNRIDTCMYIVLHFSASLVLLIWVQF